MTGPRNSVDVGPPLAARLPAGAVVGSHVVDGWLRDGGMAALYRGHHAKTGAKVAIKVQVRGDESDATTAARFVREGEVMGRLSGVPNVVRVYDADELADGRRYLVTEWVEGDNLEELLDTIRNNDSVMAIDRACRLARDVALALEAAHQAQIVHRDVKPSNVMIDRSLADREVAKLLDFGISADLGAGGKSGDLTATGVVLGTSGYVAPEQALGLPASPAFDIYALGVLMFETITGFSIPPGELGPDQLPPMRKLRPKVPAELEALVASCVSRDPRQRPASAAEVAARLGVLAGQAVGTDAAAGRGALAGPAAVTTEAAGSPEVPARTQPAEARRQGRAVLPVVLGVVALGGAIAWWQLRTPEWHGVVSTEDGALVASVPDLPGREPSPSLDPSTGSGEGTTLTAPALAEASTTGDDVEPNPPPSGTTTGDSEGEPVNVKPSPRPNCTEARAATEAAMARLDYVAALRASSNADCWPTPEQRIDRKVVRVQALIELGRYERCVKEGKGITDPRVARVTKLCRQRAEGPG